MGLLDSGGFWQGEGKAKGGDILAGLLAAVGDTLTRNSGGEGFAVQGLLGQRLGAMDEMRKRAEQEAQMQQTMALLQQAYPDLTDAQRMAMATKVGNYADFKPEANPMDRDLKTYQGWDENQRADYGRLQDMRNPWRFMGADGRPQTQSTAPLDPEEWEIVPGPGGGTGNGAGRFPVR